MTVSLVMARAVIQVHGKSPATAVLTALIATARSPSYYRMTQRTKHSFQLPELFESECPRRHYRLRMRSATGSPQCYWC